MESAAWTTANWKRPDSGQARPDAQPQFARCRDNFHYKPLPNHNQAKLPLKGLFQTWGESVILLTQWALCAHAAKGLLLQCAATRCFGFASARWQNLARASQNEMHPALNAVWIRCNLFKQGNWIASRLGAIEQVHLILQGRFTSPP
jgi:hypothetical protein